MRAGIESWLLGYWYSTRRPPWYLRLLEPVYRAAFFRVKRKGKTAPARFRSTLPLIVVGNLTAGGSGKTPLVIRLCQLATEMNFKAGVASTGYGRQSADTRVVHAGDDARICGDEPLLLAQRTGATVVVAKRRHDAIRKLEEMKLDLIISDDGLQQADLDRDMEFCVVDGARGLGNGHLLPAGPLREPATRLRQVDYVITNGVWTGKPADVDVNLMLLAPGRVCSLADLKELTVTEFTQKYTGSTIHALAGIGNPQRFFAMLDALGISVVPHEFPDHYQFTRKDFSSIMPGSAIIMTEKDAVKCRSLGLESAWYLPVDTHLPRDFESSLKDRLRTLIEEH